MAEKNKPSRAANAVEQRLLPAVSVIIPMYNTEKYIGECLDSILAQTFQNFEVIVVDDCSTDSSYSIVESYAEKFGRRLKLAKLKKNSGGAPAPRNRGIKIASGEYFYFMDADDALMPDGLEVMYTAVKKYDADIVHCEKFYSAPGETVSTDKKLLTMKTRNKIDPLETPIVDTNSLKDRITKMLQNRFWWAPWSHLVRRSLILENDIEFPKLNVADDLVFSILVYCLAEKVVILPDTVYVWRTLKDSNSRANQSNTQIERFVHRRVNDIFLGIQILTNFTNEFDFFQKNLAYKYALINFFVDNQNWNMRELYHQVPAMTFDNLIKKEFIDIGNDPVVATFLFDKMITSYVNNNNQTYQFNQFAIKAQKRIAELENEIRRLQSKE